MNAVELAIHARDNGLPSTRALYEYQDADAWRLMLLTFDGVFGLTSSWPGTYALSCDPANKHKWDTVIRLLKMGML